MGATPNQLYPSLPRICRVINMLIFVVLFYNSCGKKKELSAIEVNQQKNEVTKIIFAEVTSESGLGSFRHDNGSFGEMWFPEQMGSGGGFIDYNNDGWVDILLVGGGGWIGHTKRNIKHYGFIKIIRMALSAK